MLQIESVVRNTQTVAIGAIGLCLAASAARAQDRLGGHFGVVFPLVTHANGDTTNIGDDFKIGFPMGITVKTSDKYAFDLEVVPALDPQEDEPIGVLAHDSPRRASQSRELVDRRSEDGLRHRRRIVGVHAAAEQGLPDRRPQLLRRVRRPHPVPGR